MRAVAYIGIGMVCALAVYGGIRLAMEHLGEREGKIAVDTTAPFVKGAASAAGDQLKETLKNTPDKQLEEDAELYSRKFYPLAKGIIKGQLDAIMNDSNPEEVPKKAYETGKNVSERVIKPFAKGLADGALGDMKGLDDTVKGIIKFGQDNKDVVDSVTESVKGLGKALKENAPPLPPLPGPPPLPFQTPRFGPSSQPPSYSYPPGSSPDYGPARPGQPAPQYYPTQPGEPSPGYYDPYAEDRHAPRQVNPEPGTADSALPNPSQDLPTGRSNAPW